MSLVEGNWYNHRRLIPKGAATLKSCIIDYNDHILRAEVLVVDEIGAIFDVSRPTFIWEIRCKQFPADLYAHYWFKHKWGRAYVALGNGVEDALKNLVDQMTEIARLGSVKASDFEHSFITGPQDPAAISHTEKQKGSQ